MVFGDQAFRHHSGGQSMPLSKAPQRQEIHHRIIDMTAYVREDGLYDIEANLVDTKPFDFKRATRPDSIPAGHPLHDLWVRMTVDDELVVRNIEASSDVTPHPVCKEAESTLKTLVGERIARGWAVRVKERLRGTASCTHLMEMLIPMATTALQGINGLKKGHGVAENAQGVPLKIDTCYAYAANRAIVEMLWPAHYRPDPTPSK
jgi:hypothetical protein